MPNIVTKKKLGTTSTGQRFFLFLRKMEMTEKECNVIAKGIFQLTSNNIIPLLEPLVKISYQKE